MLVHKIPFEKIPQLSSRDKAYDRGNGLFKPFYKYAVNLEAFEKVIKDKSNDPFNRSALVEVLQEQYAFLNPSGLVVENIEKLAAQTTFTVTTAHQPSLFTGPLYYIYKIISTINLAEQLQAKYPTFQFVPVFVTGGEDHDFEEVQSMNLFNKKLVWESGESGSVGKMKTDKIKPVLEELKVLLGESEPAKHLFDLLEKAHTNNSIYSNATLQMVHELFKKYGLVILNMDNPKLKQHFIPFITKEIIEKTSHVLVEETTLKLNEIGFKTQAKPREINFFYRKSQFRERIVEEEEVYKVLNQNIQFSKEELINEINAHPERFSPNVVMRPLYQELILPNLAYIGGGGELAYWLERKSQFDHFDINFPMLIRRNSVMWLDKATNKKLDKLNINIEDAFSDTEWLIKSFVNNNTSEELSLTKQKEALTHIFKEVQELSKKINPTLEKTVLAEQTKQLKSFDQLEGKLIRAEKQKYEVQINQIRKLKQKLFPNNGLQERHDNFISLYLKYGEQFFTVLKENLNPLEKGFVVIQDI